MPVRSQPPFFAIALAVLNTEDASGRRQDVLDGSDHEVTPPGSSPATRADRRRLILSTASRSETLVIGSVVPGCLNFLVMDGPPDGSKTTAWISPDGDGAERDRILSSAGCTPNSANDCATSRGAASLETVEQTPGQHPEADADLAVPVEREPHRLSGTSTSGSALVEDHVGKLLPHRDGARHLAAVVSRRPCVRRAGRGRTASAEDRGSWPASRPSGTPSPPLRAAERCAAPSACKCGASPRSLTSKQRPRPADDEPPLPVEPVVDGDPHGVRHRVPARPHSMAARCVRASLVAVAVARDRSTTDWRSLGQKSPV